MLCEETKRSLSLYIDDAVSLPVRVTIDEHLDRCPVCRAEVVELRSISRSLSRLARPAPPANLIYTINDALMIEAAARRQAPKPPLSIRIARFIEPRLMPYTVGSIASVIMFVVMLNALRPHFEALREASHSVLVIQTLDVRYDITKPVSPRDFAAKRAPIGEESPTLDPRGALAALTHRYAHSSDDVDDMLVVADVFSNGAASLADVVNAPKDKRMLDEFESALRQNAAFVEASLDRRPDTMRVLFAVQKVQVDDRNF